MNTQMSYTPVSTIKPGKILIVDDREENLFALKELLSPQCSEITCVNSGNEALSLLLKDHQYSLILLDVQMPGLDGFETLSLMRKHPKTCDIPVIFITAIHKDEKYLHLGFDTGAVDYICKPIDPILMRSKVSVFLDLETTKQKIEDDLRRSVALEQAKQTILAHSAEGIVNIDEFGFIDFANPACHKILGYDQNDLNNKHLFNIISPELSYFGHWQQSTYFNAVTEGRQLRESNIHLYKKDGARINVDLSFGAYTEGAIKGGVLIFQDITERKKEEEALLFLATHDSLTQLPNKLMFRETVVNAINRAKRYEHELYIMFIDLDHFKHINDELGHYAGDSLLRDAAKRLRSVGRDVDVFARIGGDEFAVVFEDDNRSFDTEMVANKLLSVLKQPFYFDNQEMYISASIGVVKYPDYGKTADDLIQAADVAMYRAKQSGRNKFEHFDAQSQKEAINRSELEYNLRQALNNNEITCAYQPIVEADGTLSSFEVLMRWDHPIQGVLKPSSFLCLAEDTGIVCDLSFQLYIEAFAQLDRWQDENLCAEDIKLNFNLSSKQFFRKSIIADMQRLSSEYGIDLKRITLEVSESIVTQDVEAVSSVLNELKAMGISIAIDCYGSGYSSLRLLANLPIDYLKIDKSFINKDRPVNKKIVKSILVFAQLTDIRVVGVGVENQQQVDELVRLGVDYLQGFHIDKPKRSQEMQSFFNNEKSLF